MITPHILKELFCLFFQAGIRSVLCISCLPNLSIRISIGNKKKGMGTSLHCYVFSLNAQNKIMYNSS